MSVIPISVLARRRHPNALDNAGGPTPFTFASGGVIAVASIPLLM